MSLLRKTLLIRIGTKEMLLGVLEMYTQKDVWTSISDDSTFKTYKAKWEELQCVYSVTTHYLYRQ
jgi:hypothetical protein